MAIQVSVIGSGAEWEAAAEEVGRLLAERGCTVVTGGLGEVMAAAHRGAKAAGGTTIAVLPGERHDAANAWADHVVVTGIGHARNLAVAASGHAVIAIGGSWGTLAEIAFARLLGRPVVALRRRTSGRGRRARREPGARRSSSRYDTSRSRLSRYALSASFPASAIASRYASAASFRRSSRRSRSARAAWRRW